MGTASDLLLELVCHGIELEPHGAKLRFRPVSAVTSEQRELLKIHKSELLAILTGKVEHADREQRRFEAVCQPHPDGHGWHGPGQAALLDAIAQACAREDEKRRCTGDCPPGWTPARWAGELQRKADRCQDVNPEQAAEYRTQAEAIIGRPLADDVQTKGRELTAVERAERWRADWEVSGYPPGVRPAQTNYSADV